MTSELEQEFYKVFEISPATVQEYGATYFWDTIEIDGKRYTPIDDRKLLEMICVLSQWDADNYYQILANNMRDLKNEILNDCINFKQKLKNEYFNAQIQQLFKEEE